MERTKTAILEAFQQLLEEKPINKITVKSIVERCGINRNTFYYHFAGIPELLEYSLTSMADQLMDSLEQPDAAEEAHMIVQYLSQRKRSVLHMYRYLPREEFLLFLNKLATYVVDSYIRRAVAEIAVPEEDLAILIRYYKCTLVGLLLDWLDTGMSYDMDTMVARLCQLMDGSTRKAIEKSRKNPEK